MNETGILLVIIGAWIVTQTIGGDALKRLKVTS